MEMSERLAEYVSSSARNGFSQKILSNAKHRVLDFVGCAIAGSRQPSSVPVISLVRAVSGKKSSTIIAFGDKVDVHYAALANGVMGHSVELEDDHRQSFVHAGVTVVPAAMAMAESRNAHGRDLLQSVVIGYEVAHKIGKAAARLGSLYDRGFHPTSVCGVFGAAAAAAKVLNLAEKEIVNAFGIAGSQASGLLAFLEDGDWSKRFNAGWAAHNGVIAALLAERGFTAPHSILEGEHGVLSAYAGGHESGGSSIGELDSSEVVNTFFKPFACCSDCHTLMEAAIEVVHDHRIHIDDIRSVKGRIYSSAIPLIAQPSEHKFRPRNVVDAQFSGYYAMAVAMLSGKGSVEEFSEDMITNPRVLELAKKIVIEADRDLDREYPDNWPSIVEIVTKSGQKYSCRVNVCKGDPIRNPMTEQELTEKFEALALPILGNRKTEKVIDLVSRLDEIPVKELTRTLY